MSQWDEKLRAAGPSGSINKASFYGTFFLVHKMHPFCQGVECTSDWICSTVGLIKPWRGVYLHITKILESHQEG